MKLKRSVKKMLLKPTYFGLLINKFNKPHTTVKRWIDTDYKDLRLVENINILSEITGLSESELFDQPKKKASC